MPPQFFLTGIALLDDGQLQTGLTASILPTVRFSNEGSRYDLPNTPLNGLPISGGNGGNAGIPAVIIPYLYTSVPVIRAKQYGDLAIGLGLSAPFGLPTDYSPGWVGRYSALRAKLSTIDLQPTIAYRLWDRLSVGTSLDIQYASARLTQAIDFGLAGVQAVGHFTQALPTILASQRVPAAAIPGIVASTQRAYNDAGFIPGGRDAITDLTCRCGFAYDQTPVTGAAFRIPELPDNDQYSLAVGLRWSPTPWMDIDVGYLHIFIPEGHGDVADNHGHIVRGNFSTAGNFVSAGTTLRWGGPREEKSIAPSPK
jgi:long-subunit fatty acid transport protein